MNRISNQVLEADYGNSFDFAALVLHKHWQEHEDGYSFFINAGPTTCITCRSLWLRVSAVIIEKSCVNQLRPPAVPIHYYDVAMRVMHWSMSAEGKRRIASYQQARKPDGPPESPNQTSSSGLRLPQNHQLVRRKGKA